jgi:hypothetical protein
MLFIGSVIQKQENFCFAHDFKNIIMPIRGIKKKKHEQRKKYGHWLNIGGQAKPCAAMEETLKCFIENNAFVVSKTGKKQRKQIVQSIFS